MTKRLSQIFYIILVSALILSSGSFIINRISDINTNRQSAQVVSSITENINDIQKGEINDTSLFFLGDMMLDRGVESSVKNNFSGDFNRLFDNLPDIKKADILFANLEGPVSDTGNNVGSKYSFHMDPSVISAIKNAGFDIVSFANNHVGDWNIKAFKDTLSRLEKEGILETGAGINKSEAEKPTIIEKNGIKFGFLGFSDVGPEWMKAKENSSGILLASDPDYAGIIQRAKAKTDVLIISIHWGEEYKTIHNAKQEKLAKEAIDNGADIVIGHHPHVIEDIAEYKGKPIIYSLGNFIFDQNFSRDTMNGMLYEVIFHGKEIKNKEVRIITLNKHFQPEGIFTEDEVKDKEEALSTTCPKPDKEYNDMFLLPIGQDIGLPDETYVPKNLREVSKKASIKTVCLIKEARDSFELLVKQAEKDGLSIKAVSAYRSYNYQKNLLANAIVSGNKNADIAIAKAGYSEHQLGTAVDITGKSIGYEGASMTFDNTIEAKWLEANASDFGFVRSYPKGKEEITGYMYEPWHYRYVGVDIADEIIKSEKTTNEYLESIQ